MRSPLDLLVEATWECAAAPPGAVGDVAALASLSDDWLPAVVPGTAAAALRQAGVSFEDRDFDAEDWWFRCRFPGPPAADQAGGWLLRFGGLATIADVWLNGRAVLHSENMFVPRHVVVSDLAGDNELVVRCSNLATRLSQRFPRPRWKSYLVRERNLRWIRTTLLGRLPGWAATPAPVGPWRAVTLAPATSPLVLRRKVTATCQGDDGVVEASLGLASFSPGRSAPLLRVGSERAPVTLRAEGDGYVVEGTLRLGGVERWWPATHGGQPLYDVALELEGGSLPLGRVGFRTVHVHEEDGGFELEVNGERLFCRGATWMPIDPVSMTCDAGALREQLELVVAANMNMVRIPATGVYQDPLFWDLCDEMGILVWQDCMFAFLDPPSDQAFLEQVDEELSSVFSELSGHPALAVVCGGQEVEEQAAMLGLPRQEWSSALFDDHIPRLVDHWLPGVPYVANNPTGGTTPFRMDQGVSHYFGIGGYLRPLSSLRSDGVRFASECLAFATPPEPSSVEDMFGGPQGALDDPRWRRGAHHDAGRSWDLEDMHGFYMARTFGIDPFLVRWQDPERYLELARATAVFLVSNVLTEWRRHGSSCAGALVLALRDLRIGPGWGLVDAWGRPKAPWYALRPVLAPVAVLVSDEGLNGLRVHLLNDSSRRIRGTVQVALFVRGELCVEQCERTIELGARCGTEMDVGDLFDGFRDLNAAYGFGPPAWDVVDVKLVEEGGSCLGEAVYLPTGPLRPLEADVGLHGAVGRDAGGTWQLTVSTRRLAQWVRVEVPGFHPSDSWFHLAPGGRRTVTLVPAGGRAPVGYVQAFNSSTTARFEPEA